LTEQYGGKTDELYQNTADNSSYPHGRLARHPGACFQGIHFQTSYKHNIAA
jgi:hypothetical protein